MRFAVPVVRRERPSCFTLWRRSSGHSRRYWLNAKPNFKRLMLSSLVAANRPVTGIGRLISFAATARTFGDAIANLHTITDRQVDVFTDQNENGREGRRESG